MVLKVLELPDVYMGYFFKPFPLTTVFYVVHGNTPDPGKSLYRGKVHYHLCSCQSTLSLTVGKEENKSGIFQNNLLKKKLKI